MSTSCCSYTLMHTAQSSYYSPEVVTTELNRVLATPDFTASERISRFLRFVVEESLADRADRLKGYTVGVEVFDRDDSFDPQTDSIVRVEAGRLRRMLKQYYLTKGRDDPLRIELPKGSYVPVFKSPAPRDQAERPQKYPTAPTTTDPTGAATEAKATALPLGPSVAVLAFANMSGDPAQEYFCDGIAEEIITELTRFHDLFVIARHSSFQYKGKHSDVRQIGRELGVRYVLEGSVRRAENAVRVSAQLLDAGSGEHLWAENFDRDLTVENILQVQDSIANEVVARTASPYGVITRAQSKGARGTATDQLTAYESVLRFYDFVANENPEKHASIRDRLEQAVAIDPGYSDAWAVLAWVYGDEYRYEYNPRPQLYDALDKALEAAQRAVELDPESALAYHHLCLAHFSRGELDRFRTVAQRALALNPNNAYLLADVGVHLTFCGDWEQGIPLMEKAVALNPVYPGWYLYAFFVDCYRQGDYSGAYQHAKKFNFPAIFWSHALMAMACAQLGRHEEAQQALAELLKQYPNFESTALDHMRKRHFPNELVDKFIEGLSKAGLKIC